MSDITNKSVQSQVNAVDSALYELGVFNSTTEQMLIKTWDRETIYKSIAYLKYQNFHGNHIYIRPEGEHNFTLVDDLEQSAIVKMKKEGFEPAAIVETSPNNFQVWLKHDRKLTKDFSTRISKEFAAMFGGDPGSADWRHFGRLAGFTNCKSKYQQSNGLFPFVMLREVTGQIYSKAKEFTAQVEEKFEQEKKLEAQKRKELSELPSNPLGTERATKSINDFRNDSKYSGDYHRADLAYAMYAITRSVPENEIATAILTRDLSHKGNTKRQDEYIQRTLKKAKESAGILPAPRTRFQSPSR